MSQSLNRMQYEQEIMTEDVIEVTKPISKWKLRFMGAIAMGSGLIAVVRAGDLNNSVSPLLYELPALFTGIVALIIAAVPIIIVLSIVAFLLGLFDGILGKIKLGR